MNAETYRGSVQRRLRLINYALGIRGESFRPISLDSLPCCGGLMGGAGIRVVNGKIRDVRFRLGSEEVESVCPIFKPLNSKHISFVMDDTAIEESFRELRDKAESLNMVEKRVLAIAGSIAPMLSGTLEEVEDAMKRYIASGGKSGVGERGRSDVGDARSSRPASEHEIYNELIRTTDSLSWLANFSRDAQADISEINKHRLLDSDPLERDNGNAE